MWALAAFLVANCLPAMLIEIAIERVDLSGR
jgi:hypothetical protein